MSVETVLSIVEAANGGVVTRIVQMTAAESTALQVSAWIQRLQYLQRWGMHTYIKDMAASFIGRQAAFQTAMAQLAAQETAATLAASNAAAAAAQGTLVAGVGTTIAAVTIPIVAMVAVAVALGAPYYQAREEARKEEYASGFAQGFITGLLKWELRFTIDRLWDNAVSKNAFDEQMPTIRANAHNKGLLEGRMAGLAIADDVKKRYLLGLRMLTTTSQEGWTPRSDDWAERMRARKVQVGYVIDLAAAARRHGVIKQG
jgi:hypothetical protein